GGRPATGGHGSRWGGPLRGTGAFIVHGMRGAAVADRADPSTVDERAPARWAWRWYWVWPALLTFGAAAWQLGTPSLWADELATWGAVRLGWGQLFRLSGHVDAVVAPYYALAKVWTAVAGTSPVALRLPSAFAMAATAALV